MRRFLPIGFIVLMLAYGWSDLPNMPPLGMALVVTFCLGMCAFVAWDGKSTAGGRSGESE